MENTTPSYKLSGPRSHFLLGSMLEMRNDPLTFLMSTSKEFPRLSQIRVGAQKLFYVSHPDLVRQVLIDRADKYHKLWGYEKFYPVFGYGLLTSNGELWKRQRKMAQASFGRENLIFFLDGMVALTKKFLKRIEDYADKKQPFEIGCEVRELTMEIVVATIFGLEDFQRNEQVLKSLNFVLEETYNRVFSPLGAVAHLLPTKRNFQFRRACQDLNETILGIIKTRREKGVHSKNLLSLFMTAVDEETGLGMSDEQLKAEAMTLFVAGHETTAHTLAWTSYLLTKHPNVYSKVALETETILGKNSDPTFDSLQKMEYMKMVLDESMRYFPPSWIMTRTATEDEVLDGHKIPKGSTLIISEYAMHHDPRFWKEPETFSPERFASGTDKDRPRCAYLAFGQGPRSCIGMGFAIMEAKVILSMLLQKFDLELVSGQNVEPKPVMTLQPKNGVYLLARKK